MPKQVRNFWIELEVDGRKTKSATGPQGKDGGFKLIIKMRENGEISEKEVHIDGKSVHKMLYLETSLYTGNKEIDSTFIHTER